MNVLTGQDAIVTLDSFSADNFEFEAINNNLKDLKINEQILDDDNHILSTKGSIASYQLL